MRALRRALCLVGVGAIGAFACRGAASEGLGERGAGAAAEPGGAAGPGSAAGPDCPARVDGAPPGVLVWVKKSSFSLGVYRNGVLSTEGDRADCYAVALGGAPVGDKEARGDERTPEGAFRVTHRNPASSYHLSLGLNYPTERHARAAYDAGRIDAVTRDRIIAEDRPGRMPVRDSALGGDIYLHGGGDTPRDWTDGCVGMANATIDRVYALAGPGTPVWIVP